MLKILFPYKLYLHIFQLEDYKISRFLKWLRNNYFKRNYVVKKPMIWTPKATSILKLAYFYTIVINLFLLVVFKYLAIIPCLILSTQAYLFIILGLLTLKPYEILNKSRKRNATQKKIVDLKKGRLKVIGVTGSYGKTSVKEFLYEILKTKYRVLRTPESYNTLFGVIKVVDYELDDLYDYFICEMGAYKIGEIKELCEMVLPDHAILTGINEQHLERFKKIENTINAKFELLEYLDKNGLVVLNGNNEYIKENYLKYRENAVMYGGSSSDFYIQNVETDRSGSEFELILGGKTYKAKTNLVGNSNLENILASASMAYLLQVESQLILQAIGNLKPIPHRLEIKTWPNGLTTIDDAYNSNVTGFKAALALLNTFMTHKKVIVTPGIVELGNRMFEIHKELGVEMDSICDKILLVGKSERTLAMAEGIGNKSKITFIDSLKELPNQIEDITNTIVLIENDLPDNY